MSIEKRFVTFVSRKYIVRRSRIVNRFEVSIMNGLVVTAKIVGMLFTAKITSFNFIRISISISGVAYSNLFLRIKKCSLSMVSVMRK